MFTQPLSLLGIVSFSPVSDYVELIDMQETVFIFSFMASYMLVKKFAVIPGSGNVEKQCGVICWGYGKAFETHEPSLRERFTAFTSFL